MSQDGLSKDELEHPWHVDPDEVLARLSTMSSAGQTAAMVQSLPGLNSGVRPLRKTAEIMDPTAQGSNVLGMTQNQINAFKKYPSLIDTLGTEYGDKLVKEIIAKLNAMWVEKIAVNSKVINASAFSCEAAGKNIKQFFVPEDKSWSCVVIASGPFSGDDAIMYNKDEDRASIVRKVGDDFEDITHMFNIVHEFANATE